MDITTRRAVARALLAAAAKLEAGSAGAVSAGALPGDWSDYVSQMGSRSRAAASA